MIDNLIVVIWYFLPAGLANTAPIFAMHIPFLKKFNVPLDLGKSYRGKRILGDHKTIRGIITGIIVGVIVAGIEVWAFREIEGIRQVIAIDYSNVNAWLLGILAGAGALGGDSIKSFFKRQKNIPSGATWVPYDQVDYIIGGCVFMAFILPLSVWQYVLLFAVWFLLHPLSTYIGYKLHIKDTPL